MKILITGASGFIGRALFKRLKDNFPIGISFNSKNKMSEFLTVDLRDNSQVKELFEAHTPNLVFHLAALTSPQRNEENKVLATESNLLATKNIVQNLQAGSHLIFLSTDKVFDGSNSLPSEEDATNSEWIYGQLKIQAEELIRNTIKRHHILRLPIVHSMGDSNSGAFIDKALINLKTGKKVNIFNNVERCYIRTNELITFLVKLKNDMNYGTYHLGSEMMSYFERVRMLSAENAINWKKILIPCEGSASPMKQNLNTNKVKRIFNCSFS